MHFARGGFYYVTYASINATGSEGYFWTRGTNHNDNAISLLTTSTYLRTIIPYLKGYGFSLRCLVSLVSRQLPTYDGTKSYQNLLVEVYELTEASDPSKYKINTDSQLHFIPISLVHNGRYYFSDGETHDFGYTFYWQSSRAYDATQSFTLHTCSSYIFPVYSYARGYGQSLRCLGR